MLVRLARMPRSPSALAGISEDDPRQLALDLMLLDAHDIYADTQVRLAALEVDPDAAGQAELVALIRQIRG